MLSWLLTYEATLSCLILALVVILFFVMAISCIAQKELEKSYMGKEVGDEKSKTKCQKPGAKAQKTQEKEQKG